MFVGGDVRATLAGEEVALSALQPSYAPAKPTDIPSAATIAGEVRTNLTTELGRLDQPISSRLAGTDYIVPNNAGVAALIGTIGVAGAGLTALGDPRLARLDADVSDAVAAGNAAATAAETAGTAAGSVAAAATSAAAAAATAATTATAAQAAAESVAAKLPTADYLAGSPHEDGSIVVDAQVEGAVTVGGLTSGAIAQLAGAKIEVTAPTLTAAGMTRAIVRNRAYTGGNRLTFAISGYQGRDLTTATSIRLNALANASGSAEAWTLDHDELVVVDAEAGDYLLYFAATSAQTALAEASEYRFGIDAEFATGDPEAVLDPLHRLRVLSPATA
ncbi:MAG: hypothetical protein ACK5Q5_22480 [Planctomycetaceae bacterium]